ncbi:MAG: tetratricopeptide repeat protein [Verrucomicrobiota bacterium]
MKSRSTSLNLAVLLALVALVSSGQDADPPEEKPLWQVEYEAALAEQDFDKAYGFAEVAAADGEALAMQQLGALHLSPLHGYEDIERAIEWFEKAIEAGDKASLNELGSLYASGEQVPLDEQKAIGYFRQAAEQGDGYGYYRIGLIQESSETLQDFEAARASYQQAVDLGYAEAAGMLGVMYRQGRGGEVDQSKAAELFLIGAEGGDSYSTMYLGKVFEEGNAVEEDAEKAVALYERAIEGGEVKAALWLAKLYEFGRGVERDLEKAYSLLAAASEAGLIEAIYWRGIYLQQGAGVEKDAESGIAFLQLAYEQGSVEATYALGLSYENGDGVDEDAGLARRFIEVAAESGHARANYKLGLIEMESETVDLASVRERFKTAAESGFAYAWHEVAKNCAGVGLPEIEESQLDFETAAVAVEKALVAGVGETGLELTDPDEGWPAGAIVAIKKRLIDQGRYEGEPDAELTSAFVEAVASWLPTEAAD